MRAAPDPTAPPGLWTGQALHLGGSALLLALLAGIWVGLGRPAPLAFWVAAGVPVLHQVFVWLAWRAELARGAVSRTIGFRGYLVLFFTLFLGRFAALLWLAFMDRGSLGLPMLPRVGLTLLLLAPALVTLHGVRRHFGFARAAGGDHFDPAFRALPLVREGMFRLTPNAMYVFAFLGFWAIAVGFDSAAALAVAAASHAAIWAHYLGTERPDMAYLYSGRR